jgi:hypothetical protein
MRLSVYENGPCPGVRILLDGVERTRVVEADEEARYIVVLKVNEAGRLVLNAARDEVEKERLDGDVAIVTPPGFVPRERL